VWCRNEVPGYQHLHDVPPIRRLVLGQFAVGALCGEGSALPWERAALPYDNPVVIPTQTIGTSRPPLQKTKLTHYPSPCQLAEASSSSASVDDRTP